MFIFSFHKPLNTERTRRLKNKVFSLLFFISGLTLALAEPQVPIQISLWPKGEPQILAFPAKKQSNGVAMVICPGGAYGILALKKEGIDIALWLNDLGISAFVLCYRLGPVYHFPIQMEEGKRAIRWVRSHAKKYGINPQKIGMMGFSAGAHLTTTVTGNLSSRLEREKLLSKRTLSHTSDAIDSFSSIPNFQILIYPVISMEAAFSHRASRINLLGQNPKPILLSILSAEKNVTARTPPTFMVHAKTDPVVLFENSEAYYQACKKADVPVELLSFEKGGHAFGLGSGQGEAPELSSWTDSCASWMARSGWLD